MVCVFLILLVLLILHVHGGLSLAHNHPAEDGSYRQRENRKAQQVDHDRKEGKGEKAEEGNEATGVGSHWDNDAGFFGLVLKFKIAPVWMRRVVYRLHTNPATFSTVILLLVVGHLIYD